MSNAKCMKFMPLGIIHIIIVTKADFCGICVDTGCNSSRNYLMSHNIDLNINFNVQFHENGDCRFISFVSRHHFIQAMRAAGSAYISKGP